MIIHTNAKPPQRLEKLPSTHDSHHNPFFLNQREQGTHYLLFLLPLSISLEGATQTTNIQYFPRPSATTFCTMMFSTLIGGPSTSARYLSSSEENGDIVFVVFEAIIAKMFRKRHEHAAAAQKKLEVIQRKSEFPVKLQEAIEKWKEESPGTFLSKIESRLMELLFENYNVDRLDATKGLNCDRDTEAEVEAAIRSFPNVLSMKRRYRDYPIYAQLKSWRGGHCNLKAVPFIPLLARLGIELSQFEELERGGLIWQERRGGVTWHRNVLEELAVSEHNRDDEEYQRLIDGAFLAVMTGLREINLFKKEDIRKYDLTWHLCREQFFPAQRFRYLIDWDPDCLAKCIMRGSSDLGMGGVRSLPIHNAVVFGKNVGGFRTVFEAEMQYFPTKIGFLFHKDKFGRTSYQMACNIYGNEQV